MIKVTINVEGIEAEEKEGMIQFESFNDWFLSTPCFCCMSETHSLLEVGLVPMTRSGKRRFKYACYVVSDQSVTTEGESTNITFSLAVGKFTRDCGYDLNNALLRMPFYFLKEGGGITDYARHFYTMVKDLCLFNLGIVNTIEA
jgi:hypothetical protein